MFGVWYEDCISRDVSIMANNVSNRQYVWGVLTYNHAIKAPITGGYSKDCHSTQLKLLSRKDLINSERATEPIAPYSLDKYSFI